MNAGTDDVSIDRVVGGRGPGVVFTHGWLDDRSAWDGVIAALGDEIRSVAWSLRAHGSSDPAPPGGYSRDHSLSDLATGVALAGPPVSLVGHSLGGYLSLAYTITHPDEVDSLVLIGAGPGFRSPDAMNQWNTAVDKTAEQRGVAPGSEMLSKHVDSFVLDHLDDIEVPALVVIGERDQRFMASAAVFEKRLDVRRTVVVPGAGHSVHRSHPTEVAEAIHGFLTTV